jgi:hypothetical protein
MKKRTVGIYAKYDTSEQCLCALFLAAHIVTRYRYVTWFVQNTLKRGDPAAGFSHQWDNAIFPKNKPKFKTKVKECDTFFFFEPDNEIRDLLPSEAVTAFIPNPYAWNGEAQKFAKRCAHILLPSPEWTSVFSKYVHPRNILIWPFEPVIPGTIRSRGDRQNVPYLFYPAYGLSLTDRQFVRDVADLVKICRPEVKSVIALYHAGEQPKPGYDPLAYDWRLREYIRQTDWIIDLNPRPLFGFFPSCAGGYGLRWIGFDIPPYTDSYSRTKRYPLITKTKPIGTCAVKAVPNAEDVAKQIIRHLNTAEKVQDDGTSGSWEHRCADFLRITNQILGIHTRY